MTNRSDHPELEAAAQRVAGALKPLLAAHLPPGTGLTLFLFSYGAGGGMAYLSTAERDSMIAALEEFLANAKAERAGGPAAPTIVERLRMLERAVVQVLEANGPDVSEATALARLEHLARLVGFKRAGGARA